MESSYSKIRTIEEKRFTFARSTADSTRVTTSVRLVRFSDTRLGFGTIMGDLNPMTDRMDSFTEYAQGPGNLHLAERDFAALCRGLRRIVDNV
jgi:hypothetical protein